MKIFYGVLISHILVKWWDIRITWANLNTFVYKYTPPAISNCLFCCLFIGDDIDELTVSQNFQLISFSLHHRRLFPGLDLIQNSIACFNLFDVNSAFLPVSYSMWHGQLHCCFLIITVKPFSIADVLSNVPRSYYLTMYAILTFTQ